MAEPSLIKMEPDLNFPDHPGFSAIDRNFAGLVRRLDGGRSARVGLAAGWLSRLLSEGHICLDLSHPPRVEGNEGYAWDWPSRETWLEDLEKSPVIGRPGEERPLILEEARRLYMERYWNDERSLAESILRRLQIRFPFDAHRLREDLQRHFPSSPEGSPDRQKLAAFAAVTQGFTVISGGPGTGKTTAVLKILAILLGQPGGERLRVALTAPTGKAAMRLREAVAQGLENLPAGDAARSRLPREASTIQRLLGFSSAPFRPRRHGDRPLAADVVVVDEASMVDLPLMARLFAAVSPSARLVLLGDHDQLASVQAGSVLGDITVAAGAGEPSHDLVQRCRKITGEMPDGPEARFSDGPLSGHVVVLRHNYRFSRERGIARVCEAVREGRAEEALALLEGGDPEICLRESPARKDLAAALRDPIEQGCADALRAERPEEALARFGRFRVLTAVREGPFGLDAMNALVEGVLAAAGLLEPHGLVYPRMPVLITQNDYSLRLFNGDLGMVFSDEGGTLSACFPGEGSPVRKFAPFRLPPWEKAFAMTIHKSQGSEFDEVAVILPERDSPLLTRELIYTAISRARRRVVIWARREIFAKAVTRRIERNSGLLEKLRNPRSAGACERPGGEPAVRRLPSA